METTHAERISASIMASDLTATTRQAQRMIWKVWDRWFAHAEPRPIDADDAEEIGDILNTIGNMLFYSLREFECDTGAARCFREIDIYLDRAQEHITHATISELNDKALKIGRALRGPAREALDKARRAACDLPDAQAIAALTALIRGEATA